MQKAGVALRHAAWRSIGGRSTVNIVLEQVAADRVWTHDRVG